MRITDCHDILVTEILLKGGVKHHNPNPLLLMITLKNCYNESCDFDWPIQAIVILKV